jgi:hypothetical protein
MIRVHIVGHEFDCLAGHAEVHAHGSGSNLRVALSRAVQDLATDPQVKGRRPRTFKMSVIVLRENHDFVRDKK